MSVTVTVAAVDYTAVTLDGVAITWGRQDLSAPPAPASCTVTLLRDTTAGPVDPNAFTIGDPLTVDVTPERSEVHGLELVNWIPDTYLDRDPQPTLCRFAGRITDVTVTRDTVQLVAVSRMLSALARLEVSFPAATGESDLVTAVSTRLYYAPVLAELAPVLIETGGDTGVTVEPAASGDVNAASELQALAGVVPGGAIWETPDGLELRYTVGDRQTNTPALTFTGDELGDGWTLTKSVGDRRNTITVEWLAGTVTEDDPADIAAHGRYPLELTTPIENATDAATVAVRQLTAGTNLTWNLDGVTVPLTVLAPARQYAVASTLAPDRLVAIPELIPSAQTRYFVEGWDELLGPDRWDLTLYLSDAGLSRIPQDWDVFPASVTWDGMGAVTWDDLLTTWID